MQTLCKLLLYLSLHKTIGPLWVRTFILSLKHIPSRYCLNDEYSYNISILSLSILFHVLPTIYNEGTWTSLIPIRVIPYLTDCRFFLRWVLTCGLWRKCPLGGCFISWSKRPDRHHFSRAIKYPPVASPQETREAQRG